MFTFHPCIVHSSCNTAHNPQVASSQFNFFSHNGVGYENSAALNPNSPTVSVTFSANTQKRMSMQLASTNAFKVTIPTGKVKKKDSDRLKGEKKFRAKQAIPGSADIGKPPSYVYDMLIVYRALFKGEEQSIHFEMDFRNCTQFLVLVR